MAKKAIFLALVIAGSIIAGCDSVDNAAALEAAKKTEEKQKADKASGATRGKMVPSFDLDR
ncbi:hypothetical protein MCEMSE15_00692 [Fimbriimonadaceae bacterium]